MDTKKPNSRAAAMAASYEAKLKYLGVEIPVLSEVEGDDLQTPEQKRKLKSAVEKLKTFWEE